MRNTWGLQVLRVVVTGGLILWFAPVASASGAHEHGEKGHAETATSEHGGTEQVQATTQEHGGKEHGGTATEASAGKEHGGTATEASASKEHGGKEHGGTAHVEPSAKELRQAIRDYVAGIEQTGNAFTVEDEVTGATRTLQLVRVHERVGKTGTLYYACADLVDVDSAELLDLDFDVDAESGTPTVVEVRIHKTNGEARYTYDEQDNRIPLL